MTLEVTRRRRQAVDTIHDIVSAMRAIAAGRIQGAQRALAASREYEEIVSRSLAALLRDAHGIDLSFPHGERCTLVVLTSEQPLCGSFNQNVLSLVERRWAELCEVERPYLVLVGQRGRRTLAAMGIAPDRIEPAATTLPGVRDLVKRLARLASQRFASGELGTLRAIYSRYQSVSEQTPTEEQLLPPDLSAVRDLAKPLDPRPFHRYLSPASLATGLMGEFALISLYRIAAESFASEQASRLIAMDGATRNTERMAQSLAALEQRERQDEITRQVLELVNARFTAGNGAAADKTPGPHA
ncbi:MAG TPA: FoF1 ATP synthase subunit gamma [Pirellulales bacterium]|nr:FoF1 ATP synthase subunit gamma [Pirellulales bacterium]